MNLGEVDALPLDVLPIATDYPADHLMPWHEHRRAQLLHASRGIMLVETADGAWTVPGEHAVLIPPATPHRVRMLEAQTDSLYLEPSAVPWWPTVCRVVEINGLLRELLARAADLQRDYADDPWASGVIALILLELQRVTEVPLHVALPRWEPFAQLCRRYLANPTLRIDNRAWAREANLSERAFCRQFRELTGTSPARWRAKARLLAALPLLGELPVSDVSARLGYSTPAAFTYAFRREFGRAPSQLRSGPP